MVKTIEDEILDVYGVSRRKRGEGAQAYYARLVQATNEGTPEEQDAAWEKLGNDAQQWINDSVLAKKAGSSYAGFPDAPTEEPPEPVRAAPAAFEDEERRPRRARTPSAEEAEPPARRPRAQAKAEPDEAPPARRRGRPPNPPKEAKTEPEAPPARRGRPPNPRKETTEPDNGRAPSQARRRVVDDAPAPARRRVVDDALAPAPARKPRARRNGGGTGIYAMTQEFVVKNPNASTADIMKALEKKGLDVTEKQHTVQSVRGHTRDTLKLVQRILDIDVGITA